MSESKSRKKINPFYAAFMGVVVLMIAALAIGNLGKVDASTSGAENGYVEYSKKFSDLTDNGKVEVEAVFWYGCPFCYVLEGAIDRWENTLDKKTAELFHVPAPLNQTWANHAAAYYVAQELGILEQSHHEVFSLVKESHGQALGSSREVAKFYSEMYGADYDKAVSLFKDKGIHNKIKYDYDRVRHYGLTSVPAIVINGQYVVSGQSAGSLENMIKISDKIVKKLAAGEKIEGSMLDGATKTSSASGTTTLSK